MKTVALPTTPAQRKAFKALGLTLGGERAGVQERWDKDGVGVMHFYIDKELIFYVGMDPITRTQVLQILDLLPPPPVEYSALDLAKQAEALILSVIGVAGDDDLLEVKKHLWTVLDSLRWVMDLIPVTTKEARE